MIGATAKNSNGIVFVFVKLINCNLLELLYRLIFF